jgi:hypothetical protein
VDAEAAHAPRTAQGKPAGRLTRWRRSRARPGCFSVGEPFVDRDFLQQLNCATKTVDIKVVDESSLYNICKGCPMFFSTI